jgi:hypothetical protein
LTTTVSVSTIARGMAAPHRLPPHPMVPPMAPVWCLALAALLASATSALLRRARVLEALSPRLPSVLLFIAMLAAVTLTSCGGGASTGHSGTPIGTYNLTVVATTTSGSATLTHKTRLTLNVN